MRVIGNVFILAVIVGVLVLIVKKNEPKWATPILESLEDPVEEDLQEIEGPPFPIEEITLTPEVEPVLEESEPAPVERIEVVLQEESPVADLEERDEPVTTDQALLIFRALKGSRE